MFNDRCPAMPRGLRAHIRYPEDFFLIQADTFRNYHNDRDSAGLL